MPAYGVLQKTLVFKITSSLFLRISTPTTHILALVLDSRSYTLTPMSFTALSNTTQIIALALVSLVCCCFQYGMTLPQWAIINCSTELVQHIKTCYVCTVHCSTLLNKMMFRYDLNSGKLQHAKVGIWVYQLQTGKLVIYHFLNTTPKLINGELPSTMQ